MAIKELTDERETSYSSEYVDENFYDNLVDQFSDWAISDRQIQDIRLIQKCKNCLFEEARLIDEARFESWLGMFVDRCIYWAPISPGGSDPRKEVTLFFDDRRRMEDRIYRFRTGYAWSQIPPSRTTRRITNIEVFDTEKDDELMVRSNFEINEFRAGERRNLAGWYGHWLRETNDGLRIVVKQINLIDSDQGHHNLTLIL